MKKVTPVGQFRHLWILLEEFSKVGGGVGKMVIAASKIQPWKHQLQHQLQLCYKFVGKNRALPKIVIFR